MVSEYRLRRRVLFYEADPAGIVHFSWFFRYMEEAEHALWREAGLSIAPHGADIGWPRLAASFEYHRPLRFEDEFEVHVRLTAASQRSLTYAHTIRRGDTVIATGTMTAVCVRKSPLPMKAVELPAAILERLGIHPSP